MRIAVDVDGVLADLATPLMQFHNENYGTDFSYEDVVHHELEKVWGGSRKEAYRKVHEFFDSKFFDAIEPYPGVLERVQELSREHELVILTSRTKEIEDKNRWWIEEHFPGIFDDILHSDGKGKIEICSDIGAGMLIDDYTANFSGAVKMDVSGLLMTQPWNRDKEVPEKVRRVIDWDGVLRLLL